MNALALFLYVSIVLYLITPLYVIGWLIRQSTRRGKTGAGTACLAIWFCSALLLAWLMQSLRLEGNTAATNFVAMAWWVAILLVLPATILTYLELEISGRPGK